MVSGETDPVTGISHIRMVLHRDRKARSALGGALRQERARRGWTLRELASQVGDVTEQYVGMVERGERKPSQEVFMRLLSALQLAPEVRPDGGVVFWCSEGREHVTVHLSTFIPLAQLGLPEWDVSLAAEDQAKLGHIVAVVARDRDALMSVYRHLGLDKDFDAHLEAEEAAAEVMRGR